MTAAPEKVKDPMLLTVPAAAGHIGVSVGYVYELIASGDLRAIDISRPGARSKTRIRREDLKAYIDRLARTA